MILCAFAEQMRQRLTGTLPQADLRALAREVVRREGGRMRSLADALGSGLVEVRQGRCWFRHELLERAFQAEALAIVCPTSADIANELSRPRNRKLAEFVVGAAQDVASARACLAALADGSAVGECLRGRWGEAARDAVSFDCTSVLRKAERALDEVEVDLPESEESRALEVRGGPTWSAYELVLLQAIGAALPDGAFLREAFALVRRTEETFRSLISIREGTPGTLTPSSLGNLFASLFVFGSRGSAVPGSVIYHASRLDSGHGRRVVDRSMLDPWIDRLRELMPGELMLLCQLFSRLAGSARGLPDLVRRCWASGFYHLRLEGLELAERFARGLEGPVREAVANLVSSFTSRNLNLTSAITETLMAFGLVEPLASEEDAAAVVAEIMLRPDDPQAQSQAYMAVCNMFEELFQESFYSAIEALSPGDRVRLLCMAALGAPSYGYWTSWILAELLATGNPSAVPAFRHWASSIDPNTYSRQEAAANFLLACAGCGLHLPAPLALVSPATEEGRAWQTYGAIVYWLFRPGITAEERRAACAAMWELLRGELAFEAVDPLFRMAEARRIASGSRPSVFSLLCEHFQDEVRGLLEFGLQHRERLTSLFLAYSRDAESLTSFLIRYLGEIGDNWSAHQLEAFADLPNLGGLAVEAIRRIDARSAGR
jgi:hypothetical protein